MWEIFLRFMIPEYALPFTSSSVGVYGISCLWILFAIVSMFGSNDDENPGPWRYSIALGYVILLCITNALGGNHSLWVYWLVPGIYMTAVSLPYIGQTVYV
jgi:hypothetical protein